MTAVYKRNPDVKTSGMPGVGVGKQTVLRIDDPLYPLQIDGFLRTELILPIQGIHGSKESPCVPYIHRLHIKRGGHAEMISSRNAIEKSVEIGVIAHVRRVQIG